MNPQKYDRISRLLDATKFSLVNVQTTVKSTKLRYFLVAIFEKWFFVQRIKIEKNFHETFMIFLRYYFLILLLILMQGVERDFYDSFVSFNYYSEYLVLSMNKKGCEEFLVPLSV
jgi:hypothetical protein